MKSRILTIVYIVAIALLIITFSIGLPIYVRPFYYAHIAPLDLVEDTGKTVEQIKDGYDEVLDYLTLPGREFSAGDFAYSEEGKSHFEDCKVLFDLNAIALLASAAVALTLWSLNKRRLIELQQPWGFAPTAVAGTAVLALFLVLAVLVAIDFDAAFTAFHTLFFPGKANWLFDPATDEIILALPETFFMNCAILIGGSVIAISAFFAVRGYKKRKGRGA
jgi:integral membrane protein (TIGR01906 family)